MSPTGGSLKVLSSGFPNIVTSLSRPPQSMIIDLFLTFAFLLDTPFPATSSDYSKCFPLNVCVLSPPTQNAQWAFNNYIRVIYKGLTFQTHFLHQICALTSLLFSS